MTGVTCGAGTAYNNISVISWHSVFLVEETVVSWENHRPDLSYRWNIITYGFIEYNSTPDKFLSLTMSCLKITNIETLFSFIFTILNCVSV
jgi:hypothetical protein